MIHRLPALKSDIPITFICGGRSWIDPKTSYSMKDIMKNSSVHVHVIFPFTMHSNLSVYSSFLN